MPKVTPAKFSRPNVLKKVKPANLLAVLKPFRGYLTERGFVWPKSDKEPIDYGNLAKVLTSPRPDTPPELVDNLELIDILADDQQLFEFEGDYHALVSELQEPEDTAADIALKILLYSPDVAWRAFDKRAVHVKRSLASFLASVDKPFREPNKMRLKKLEAEMSPWFESKNRSNACRVHAMQEDGSWAFIIRHGDPVSRVGTITDQGESSSVLFRPERLDVAFFSLQTCEWLISGSRTLKEMYQERFGEVLHGSHRALSPSNRYTLEPLRRGPDVLAESGIEGVRTAVLKEVTLLLPNGVEMSLKKSDVFAELMRQNEQHQDAIEFVEAKFGILLSNRRRWVQVVVSPARNSVSCSMSIVESWLEDRGFIIHANAEVLAGAR